MGGTHSPLERRSRSLVDRLSSISALPARSLLLTSRHPSLRIASWFFLILMPVLVAVFNLPGLAIVRYNFIRAYPQFNVLGSFPGQVGYFASWAALVTATLFYFGWSNNERVRQAMAQGMSNNDSHSLPDLMPLAAITALVVLTAIPLAMFFTNLWSCRNTSWSCAYSGPTTRFLPWALYDADLFMQLFPFWILHDALRLPNVSSVQPLSAAAFESQIALRTIWQTLVISSVISVLTIYGSIRAAISALEQERLDPILMIGRRALPRLFSAIRKSESNDPDTDNGVSSIQQKFLKEAARAIGVIGDRRSLPKLQRMADLDRGWSTPRRLAVDAMIDIIRPLRNSLRPVAWWHLTAKLRSSRTRGLLARQRAWAEALLAKEKRLLEENRHRHTLLLMDSLRRLISMTTLTTSQI